MLNPPVTVGAVHVRLADVLLAFILAFTLVGVPGVP